MWVNVEKADQLFFVRSKSLRTLANYYRQIGARRVLIKVASRRSERVRNEKWLSFGIGVVAGAGPDCPWDVGTSVVFVAPSHSRCMERVVLPFALIREIPPPPGHRPKRLRYVSTGPDVLDVPDGVRDLLGWSAHSGEPSADTDLTEPMHALARYCTSVTTPAQRLRTGSPVRELTGQAVTSGTAPRGTLFGYGNYAKTVILPSIEPWITITRIHEYDPTQIGPRPSRRRVWDTAPQLRAADRPDVVIVAGYHHSHAPLAVAALERGAKVILEKPLATTLDQLDRLCSTLEATEGTLFACFQRRYSAFNDRLRGDLGAPAGAPLDYYCLVYEEPLPRRHWYRWPVSRSRLVSNGCHWIDHFLFLNSFATVTHAEATVVRSGALNVALQLENGAHFTMTLSDRGSDRIGLQDYVEVRSDGAKAAIQNSSIYTAERGNRIVGRSKTGRLDAHTAMYRTIALAIVHGHDGDPIHSIRQSAGVTLHLEDQIRSLFGLDGVPTSGDDSC